MIVPIPSDGARQGWKDLGDGKMAAMMYRFMQQDVDEGRIWYKHSKGDKSNSDFFLFQVRNRKQMKARPTKVEAIFERRKDYLCSDISWNFASMVIKISQLIHS